MTPTTYLKNIDARKYTPFRIRNGEGFYLLKQHEIPAKDFEDMHPIPLIVRVENDKGKGENCDHTKDWLFN